MQLDLADYDYELPNERIADHPPENRGDSRLLVADRETDELREMVFSDISCLFNSGDLLILNDTKVIRARLRARRPSGGRSELFFLRPLGNGAWLALSRPLKRLRPGLELAVENGDYSVRIERIEDGFAVVSGISEPIEAILDACGVVPLPPYILQARENRGMPILDENDDCRYQTVYAEESGAVAAPTAGLHFTRGLLDEIRSVGVHVAGITLHVGYGTFRPVTEAELAGGALHEEWFHISEETAEAVAAAKERGGRIIAVGTTAVRALESACRGRERMISMSGWTDLLIAPGFKFQVVTGMITNFHLPRSSLLLLVAAFSDRERILSAYRYAIRRGYRFYSYGDAMFIA